MTEICRTRRVAADPRSIWAVLADFGSIASWAPSIDHSCLLTPAADGIGPGATRRVQIGRDTLVERITEFDAPRALAYDVEGFPRLVRHVNNRWTLKPSGDATIVALTSTIDTGGKPLQRMAGRAIARFGARQLDALLAGLTHRMEDSRV